MEVGEEERRRVGPSPILMILHCANVVPERAELGRNQ